VYTNLALHKESMCLLREYIYPGIYDATSSEYNMIDDIYSTNHRLRTINSNKEGRMYDYSLAKNP
jgi:hypothetical protein